MASLRGTLSNAVITRLQENGSSSSSGGHGSRGPDVDGEQAGQQTDSRQWVFLPEEAPRVRPIANCSLRARCGALMGSD